MKFGIKKIRILIKDDVPKLGENGELSNRIGSAMLSNSGDKIFERVGSKTFMKYRGYTMLSKTDIDKLNLNIDTYCSANNKTKSEVFDIGEKHIRGSLNKTKYFPIDSIAILRNNGTAIENITELCTIDLIEGTVFIPEAEDTGICSFLYSVKKMSIESIKNLEIPRYNRSGIQVLTV
jgi:hypothetical protein